MCCHAHTVIHYNTIHIIIIIIISYNIQVKVMHDLYARVTVNHLYVITDL